MEIDDSHITKSWDLLTKLLIFSTRVLPNWKKGMEGDLNLKRLKITKLKVCLISSQV